jgi:hypothetical protein
MLDFYTPMEHIVSAKWSITIHQEFLGDKFFIPNIGFVPRFSFTLQYAIILQCNLEASAAPLYLIPEKCELVYSKAIYAEVFQCYSRIITLQLVPPRTGFFILF